MQIKHLILFKMKNKYFNYAFKIIITCGCFGFLYLNLDFEMIKRIISDLEFNNILPLIITFFLYLLLYAFFIFKIYDHLFQSKLTLNTWLKIFVNGNFLNSIPFLGFIYKGYKLKDYGISVKKYLFANIFISWFAITIFFFIYSIEIAFLVNTEISLFNIPIYLILILISILGFFGPRIAKFVLENLNINIEILNSLLLFLEKTRKQGTMTKHFLSLGFLLHIFVFSTYFFIIKFLSIPIGFKIIVILFLINEIIDSIPIPNNNFLLTEIIGGFTATFVGVAFTEFVLIKFAFRIINLIIIIPIFLFINILFKSEL